MNSSETNTVGIIGAGTMGAGIAQVAAQHGWTVELKDVDEQTVRDAIAGITKRFDRLVEKERMTADERDDAVARLLVASCPNCLRPCSLIIEAIVEDVDIKAKVLGEIIPSLDDDCIIATNTSSLSVSEIGERIGQPQRTVGMHFFNPAPLMELVEVISGKETLPEVADRTASIAQSWEKKVARAADVPGFIVNHVARPYYLEAFRILEDGFATPAQIDDAMKRVGYFRMGPLELTDLIGQDVNTATTRSVWQQLDEPPLLRPSWLQEQLVSDGKLGRKTGCGVYDYSADGDGEPRVDLQIDQKPLQMSDELRAAVADFANEATEREADELQQYVLSRIVIAIIAQAVLAEQRGVATAADIDTALQYGVNYPMGPFAWAEQIGFDRCARLLDALNATVDDGRFAVPETMAARIV